MTKGNCFDGAREKIEGDERAMTSGLTTEAVVEDYTVQQDMVVGLARLAIVSQMPASHCPARAPVCNVA